MSPKTKNEPSIQSLEKNFDEIEETNIDNDDLLPAFLRKRNK